VVTHAVAGDDQSLGGYLKAATIGAVVNLATLGAGKLLGPLGKWAANTGAGKALTGAVSKGVGAVVNATK
jgi:hypothetical protein